MIMQKIPFGLKKIQEAAAQVSEESSSLTESSLESDPDLEQIDEAEDSMGIEMSKSSKSGSSLAQQKEGLKPKPKKPKRKVIKP